MKKATIEIYDGDMPLAGEGSPKHPKQIADLIKLLATICDRFGNTAVEFSLSWGASALNRREQNESATVIFSRREIRHLQESPEAIRIVADYHDLNESMAYAAGANPIPDKERRVALNIKADALEAKIEAEG